MAAPPPPTAKRAGQAALVVRAMYAYNAQRSDELSFAEGDILYILGETKEKGWLKARANQKEGLIPENYVGENTESIDNPMHEAAKRGNTPFMQELVAAGISVNGLDYAGNTPMHWAARGGHVECVKLLLSKNPVLDKQNKLGDTPLHNAAWGGHVEVIKLLLQKGVDTSITNKEGQTPYMLAKTDEAAALLQVLQADPTFAPGDQDPDSD